MERNQRVPDRTGGKVLVGVGICWSYWILFLDLFFQS